MLDQIQPLVDEFRSQLEGAMKLRAVGEWVEITTPYLDRHNDYIQIYARQVGDRFLLNDDGYTIDDLQQLEIDLDAPGRPELLQQVLDDFGVELDDGVLVTRAARDDFAARVHSLIQAILAVNVLFQRGPAQA